MEMTTRQDYPEGETSTAQYWSNRKVRMAEQIAADREASAMLQRMRMEATDKDAAFRAAWPLEVTQARRAEFNARVKAGEFTGANGKIDYPKLRAAEERQGWCHEELKKAVALHGLK